MSDYRENAEFVKKYLDDNDWKYEMSDRGHVSVATGGIGGFDGVYNSFRFLMLIGDDDVQNYAVMPMSAKTKLAEMAEFITRANYGLRNGAFEMDYGDGEVRFHMTFPMAGVRADPELVGAILGGCAQMLHKYSKGFMEVLMGMKSPEAAVKDCEEG